MEDAKEKTKELVERFHLNLDAYKSGSYNETQLRREFIDPFFEALGWDVQNKQGYAEQYKEVVHEDSIKVGISIKAPDYSFRIGGQRKFFLETKKPAINIKEDTAPAYQLRRYAWSAKLPLSILTDFEEFAVYDCRIKPNPSDKVSTGRIAYYTYEQYIGKFDEIYDRFSKEAVLKGSFDRYIETTKGMRGTAEVDKEFLHEIESWRESLAKNLALRNPRLTVEELNFAVQQTIDRIIFLRICEDRGIESYGRLQALLNGTNTYMRLFEQFYQADAKYNSGLFDFHADALSHTLAIDDKALKDIVEGLYYPNSPYEFSVLGAEILGNVYEQFLGKVIRLTAGHAAKVEEKPEVKKAGGVYYTPSYIVRYIVENTVGKLLEGKTPKQAEKLRILDPACGSGSFLIGAYQHLLDWHTKWYNENSPEKYATGKKPAVYRSRAGWQLTTTEKKRILLNNIFGVDIDRQAVEVTKLSLLLKVLEGENEETLGKTLALFRERALPDLKDNIKCGNSLIGPDFYDSISPTLPFIPSRQGRGKAPSPLAPHKFNRGLAGEGTIISPSPSTGEGWGEGEMDRRVNVFDWNDNEKGFGKIMKDGGFDCVIGNPPYVRPENVEKKERTYFIESGKYEKIFGRFDIYILFVEKALKLLSEGGVMSFILPSSLFNQNYAKNLREWILKDFTIEHIEDLSAIKVFKNATVQTAVIVVKAQKPTSNHKTNIRKLVRPDEMPTSALSLVSQNLFLEIPNHMIRTDLNQKAVAIIKKMKGCSMELSEICYVVIGAVPHDSYTGASKDRLISVEKTKQTQKYYIEGKDMGRYEINWRGLYLNYIPNIMHRPKFPQLFENKKLVVRNISTKEGLLASFDDKDYYTNDTLSVCLPWYVLENVEERGVKGTEQQLKNSKIYDLRYILGLINSKALNFYFKKVLSSNLHVYPEAIRNLPVKILNFSKSNYKSLHDKIVSLVDNMLELNKKLRKVKTPHEKELLERQIKITDNQIDRLVYELYGLTEEEIRVVEGK